MNKKNVVIFGSIFVRCDCVLCLWEITLTRGQSGLKRLEATRVTPIYRQHWRRWFEWTKQFTSFYQLHGFTHTVSIILFWALHGLCYHIVAPFEVFYETLRLRKAPQVHRVKMSTGVSLSAAPFAPGNWFEAKQTVVVWESSSVVLALSKWEPAILYFAHFIFCLLLRTLPIWLLIFFNVCNNVMVSFTFLVQSKS